jgi:DNA helicase-2/ATP-dependent DNA helicase PcrA
MARTLKTAKTTSKNAKASKASPSKAQPKKTSKAKASKVVVVTVAKLDKKRCQRCSKFNPIEDTICNWCEKPVKKAVKVSASKPKASPPPPVKRKPPVQKLDKRKCDNCGKFNPTEDAECNWCEKPTRKPAPAPTPRTAGDLYFDPVTETMRVGKPPSRGGQYGPSPTPTEAELNRRYAKPDPKPDAPRVLTTWTGPVTVASATAPHVILIARAGTGKTTTLIGGSQKAQGVMPRAANGQPMVPSEQQRAVWDTLALSKGARSIGLTSFSNTIVDELKERVKGTTVQAFTLHSYGWAAVRRRFKKLTLVKEGLYKFMLADLMGETLNADLYKRKGNVIDAVDKLVRHCKMNLAEPTADNLDQLASHYDIEIDQRDRTEVYNYVPAILDKCKAVTDGGRVAFDDMVWLPVVLKLPVDRFELLMVDEAQDLNRCQQALARMAVGDTGRLVFCGDPRQAIFGFAGADNESMDRMQRELATTTRGVEVLKLTKTRRCGKVIVDRVKRIVDDFEAFESNPTGVITEWSFAEGERNFRKAVRNRDMVICRTNAPLISQCFKFLREGKTAVMLGRTGFGDKLEKMVKQFEAVSVVDLIQKTEEWLKKEQDKEQAKKIPSENRLINLQDQHDCIMCFCEGVDTVAGVLTRINELFTDDRKADAIRLSSIHKSKGLESDRVFFINTEKAPCPHPMAKSAWAQVQEENLLYVGETRAISELALVA